MFRGLTFFGTHCILFAQISKNYIKQYKRIREPDSKAPIETLTAAFDSVALVVIICEMRIDVCKKQHNCSSPTWSVTLTLKRGTNSNPNHAMWPMSVSYSLAQKNTTHLHNMLWLRGYLVHLHITVWSVALHSVRVRVNGLEWRLATSQG